MKKIPETWAHAIGLSTRIVHDRFIQNLLCEGISETMDRLETYLLLNVEAKVVGANDCPSKCE